MVWPSQDWEERVRFYAAAAARLEDPDVADGQCLHESIGLVLRIDGTGARAELWVGEGAHRPERPNAWGNHYFVVVNGETAVDITGRQFWPDSDYPIIEPLDDYRKRFESIEPDTDFRW